MDWENERYVRLYVRTTADLIAVGWEGRLVWYELLRHLDRAGVLDHGGDLDVLPDMLRIPPEICTIGLDRLKARGCIEVGCHAIVCPNFEAAQEAKQSDAQRQRESRANRRARARVVTERDAGVTNRNADVTFGHAASRLVTPSLAEPSLAEPDHMSRSATVTGCAGDHCQSALELPIDHEPEVRVTLDPPPASKRPNGTAKRKRTSAFPRRSLRLVIYRGGRGGCAEVRRDDPPSRATRS
jgi:hypothetical protein